MSALYEKCIQTMTGEKTLAVYHSDITKLEEQVDIYALSCFENEYCPAPSTIIHALERAFDISISKITQSLEIDLRHLFKVWLSKEVSINGRATRISGIEMRNLSQNNSQDQNNVLTVLENFFQMLEMAATRGVKMDTVALPILGAGLQRIDTAITLIPLINECLHFLKNCPSVKRIFIVELDAPKAYIAARTLEESYTLKEIDRTISPHTYQEQARGTQGKKDVFLSYSKSDYAIMQRVCNVLEAKGLNVWFAPRDIWGSDYATSIVTAIESCTFFVTLISKDTLNSRHVLNEIDLAFNRLPDERRLLPILLDDITLPHSFIYYLSRLQWYQWSDNSSDAELEQFANKLLSELNALKA